MNWRAVSDAAPHGNIRRADLHDLGVADSTIARRTQNGLWVPLLPGLLRLANGTLTEDELIDAAVRYGGDEAVVSGRPRAGCTGCGGPPTTAGSCS